MKSYIENIKKESGMAYIPPHTVSKPELLVDQRDAKFRNLVHETLAFSTRIQSVRSYFAERLGLTDTGYSILITLAHLGENKDIGVRTIADHLHLTGAFVTNEINKLVQQGLLEKHNHPDDGRRVILRLTPTGKQALETLSPIQRQVNDALFDTLNRDEFLVLVDLMSRLVKCGDEALALVAYLSERDQKRA